MACPGDARADALPSPHRGAPFRGSWFSTWAGDDTRPAGQQTVLKSGVVWGILLMGLTSVIPSWSCGARIRIRAGGNHREVPRIREFAVQRVSDRYHSRARRAH